jgi:hypothetical protein
MNFAVDPVLADVTARSNRDIELRSRDFPGSGAATSSKKLWKEGRNRAPKKRKDYGSLDSEVGRFHDCSGLYRCHHRRYFVHN